MTDGKILELFFDRSQQALEEVRAKYGGKLFRLAQNLLGSRLDAEECVNDAYMTAWNTIPPRRPDPLLPYLYVIVRHHAMNRYRLSSAAKRGYGEIPRAMEELKETLASPDTAESDFDRRELTRILNRFLSRLSKRDRALFMGRYYAGESFSSMAQKLDMSQHNCEVRLSRIRKKLRETLRKEGVL